MISKRKIVALAAGIVAVGGASMGVVSASAQGALPDSVTCSFTGTTQNLTAIPAASQGAHAPSNVNPNAEEGTAPYTTDSTGTYGFSGQTVSCTGVDSNGTLQSAGSISSSGTYYNVVCGTGNAFGTATLWSGSTPGTGSVVATVNYTITFTNGEGTLKADVTAASDGVTIDADGSVSIVPTQGNCATSDVTQFTVAGSVSGSGTGDADDSV